MTEQALQSADHTAPKKSKLKLLLKVVISISLLVFLFGNAGLENTFKELSQANLWYVPLGVVIYVLSQGLSAYRWQFLSRAIGFNLAWREMYDYYLIGMYFNLFLPSAIGGDVGKMVMLAKSGGRKKREALLTILAERGVGLIALLILTSLICLTPVVNHVPPQIRLALIAIAATGVIGFIVLHKLPLEALAEKHPKLALLIQAKVYWHDYGLLAKSVGISLVYHGLMVWVHCLIAQALSVEISPLYLVMVYGVVSLVSVLPVSFNGIGLREGAYQYLLTKAGLSNHTALAFGLYWFLISTLTSLVGGLVMLKGHYKTPTEQEIESG